MCILWCKEKYLVVFLHFLCYLQVIHQLKYVLEYWIQPKHHPKFENGRLELVIFVWHAIFYVELRAVQFQARAVKFKKKQKQYNLNFFKESATNIYKNTYQHWLVLHGFINIFLAFKNLLRWIWMKIKYYPWSSKNWK